MIHLGFASTTTVNGEVVPNYAAEQTNNNTVVGKMINSTIELLKRYRVKGINGVVGNYDVSILGEACHNIYLGAVSADVYGITVSREYFRNARLI
jgi:hypothetical protein